LQLSKIAAAEKVYHDLELQLRSLYGDAFGDTGIELLQRNIAINARDAAYRVASSSSWYNFLNNQNVYANSPLLVRERGHAQVFADYWLEFANAQASKDAAVNQAFADLEETLAEIDTDFGAIQAERRREHELSRTSAILLWSETIGNLENQSHFKLV
jgi:hypothetical protein